jgi:hypothetical protein
MQYITTKILITEIRVSNETKNIIPLKFLRKIKKKSYDFNLGAYDIHTRTLIHFSASV